MRLIRCIWNCSVDPINQRVAFGMSDWMLLASEYALFPEQTESLPWNVNTAMSYDEKWKSAKRVWNCRRSECGGPFLQTAADAAADWQRLKPAVDDAWRPARRTSILYERRMHRGWDGCQGGRLYAQQLKQVSSAPQQFSLQCFASHSSLNDKIKLYGHIKPGDLTCTTVCNTRPRNQKNVNEVVSIESTAASRRNVQANRRHMRRWK